MPEKVFQSLESFEYVMLLVCTMGIIVLVAKSYNISVNKEGASGNPWADGHNLRFSSMRDDTGASVSKYEGLASRRNYEGMLGANEPPVFWGNVYSESAAGQSQAAGLDADDGTNSDGDAWSSTYTGTFQNPNQEGARARRRSGFKRSKEGMLDAALTGANVTTKNL